MLVLRLVGYMSVVLARQRLLTVVPNVLVRHLSLSLSLVDIMLQKIHSDLLLGELKRLNGCVRPYFRLQVLVVEVLRSLLKDCLLQDLVDNAYRHRLFLGLSKDASQV